jgi:hypothetical protein
MEERMTNLNLLRLAYVANIVILVPVVHAMLFGRGVEAVFEGRVEESAGLRLMVGSLWAAILLASVFGLSRPLFFAPVLYQRSFFLTDGIRARGWWGGRAQRENLIPSVKFFDRRY